MKKDIPVRKVTDIAIAALPSIEDPNFWDVYFLNLKDHRVKNVLVSSRGYGTIEGEKKKQRNCGISSKKSAQKWPLRLSRWIQNCLN